MEDIRALLEQIPVNERQVLSLIHICMCFYIINLAGQLMDMEMGLSMANMFDPMVNMQFSVTGSLYNYLLMLMLVVTNMHYYIIRAIVDSFSYFNVGKAVFDTVSLKNIVVDFIANYFIIAVRIVLPVFCCMLLINVCLLYTSAWRRRCECIFN